MFKFKGISSTDMQVIIEEEEHFIARARQRYEMTEIEGRDGAIFEEQGYSVVERPILVQCLNIEKIDDILAWLDGEGEFEYKGRKTTARFYSELEPRREACIRIIDTTFIRDPFWNKANDEYVTLNESRIKHTEIAEELEINDCAGVNAKIEIVSGKSWQETRDSYNLLDFRNAKGETSGGITATINKENGTYTLNGTATSSVINIWLLGGYENKTPLFTLPVGNYYIKDCILFDKNHSSKSGLTNLTEDFVVTAVRVPNLEIGQEYVNQIMYPMIAKSDIEVPFMQYGDMPSPDFLSEIRNVGDNVNIYDPNTMPLTRGLYVGGSNDIVVNNSGYYVIVPIIGGETYTISKKYNSTTGGDGIGLYYLTTKEYPEVGVLAVDKWTGNASYTELTIKTSKEANYLFLCLLGTGNATEELKQKAVEELKISNTPISTPYTPYGCGSIDFKVENKNIINLQKYFEGNSVNACTKELLGNIIRLKFAAGADAFIGHVVEQGRVPSQYGMSELIEIKSHIKYILSMSSSPKCYITFFTEDFVSLGYYTIPSNYNKCKFEFTTPVGTKYFALRIGIQNNNYTQYDFTDIQLIEYENYKENEIVPHQEQIVSFPLSKGQVLHEGDYLADDGVHSVRETLELNGTEDWYLFSNSEPTYPYRYYFTTKRLKAFAQGISTHFKNWYDNGYINKYTEEGIGGNGTPSNINIYVNDETIGGHGEEYLKSWLASQKENGTPVKVEYELAEEIVTPYTPEQQEAYYELQHLLMYEGYTRITCIDEMKPDIQATYKEILEVEVKNEGNIASRPILKLNKTEAKNVDLTINDVRFKYNFLENEDYAEIDCKEKTTKYDNLNRNRQIEIGYEFPKLLVGKNKIIFNDGDAVLEMKRKDRWL